MLDPSVTFRRLVLAKQIYLHGLGHSTVNRALDKIIAIHNFHNAIEITLKAILLKNDIRAEKQMNMQFEVMLNEIDSHKPLRDKGQKLPYRQELRNLNEIRNLAQHHATEPEETTMEEWRVFSKRFLARAFSEYFDLSFDEISQLSAIENEDLKSILGEAQEKIGKKDWLNAVVLSKLAFDLSIRTLHLALPNEGMNSSFFAASEFRKAPDIKKAIEKIYQRIRQAELLSSILSSGVSLAEFKRLEQSSPQVIFMVDGHPNFFGKLQYTEEEACWVYEFVTNTIVNWQQQGLAPSVPPWAREGVKGHIEKYKDAIVEINGG